MKRIIAVCIASAISMAVQAGEESDRQRPPIVEMKSASQMSQEGREERRKAIEELEDKRAYLGELERLAVPVGTLRAPSREQVLPYRFSDVSKLQAMLRDPEWSNSWLSISSTIGKAADKKAAIDLIAFVKSSEAPAGHEQKWNLEQKWNEARIHTVAMLGYTLIDQEVPEVLAFLEKMTDLTYAESLNFGTPGAAKNAQHRAYLALAMVGTDDTVGALERALSRKLAQKGNGTVRALSASGQLDEDVDGEIKELKRQLHQAKLKRSGIAPEVSKTEMP